MPDRLPLGDEPAFTLEAQIACVEREIAMREMVYPRWISAGRMRKEVAERETECMRAVAATLRGMRP